MSIQRYDILHPKMRDKGRFVFYADHIADKAADLHHLLSTLADIRAALGVGEKPMMSELAGIVRTRMGVINLLERDAKDRAAEVERLTAERDAAVRERDAAKKALSMWERPHDDKDLLAMQEQAKGGGLAAMQAYINALKWHLKQKSMERDAAVEALRSIKNGEVEVFDESEGCLVCVGMDEEEMQEIACAVLTKIEGEQG